MSPGFRAFATGVKHAMLADNVLQTFGLYPNNNQMPPLSRNVRKGNRTSKTTYRKKRVSPKTTVKKTILGMAQTYHRGISDATIASNLVHNNIVGYNISAQIQQTTTLAGRQGDQVYLMGLKLKGVVTTPTTAGAYKYRVLVYFSGEEFNPASLGTAVGSSEIFLPNTVGNYTVHGQINNKAITLLSDQIVDVNSTISGVQDVASVDINLGLYRKFEYQADGSAYGKTSNLYVSVIPFVASGVAGTTSCGQAYISADLTFKNL